MFRSLKKLNDLPTLNVCNKDYWGSWEARHRLFPFTSSQTQRDQCCLNFVIVLTLCLFFPVNKWNYFVPQSIKIRETKDKKTLFENVFILFSNMCMIIRGLLFFLYGNSNFSQSVWSLFTPWLDWFSLPRLTVGSLFPLWVTSEQLSFSLAAFLWPEPCLSAKDSHPGLQFCSLGLSYEV